VSIAHFFRRRRFFLFNIYFGLNLNKVLFCFCVFISLSYFAFSQTESKIENEYGGRVGKIYIDNQRVFEKDDADWFFAAPLLNALHFRTRPFIIEDELLFAPDEPIDEQKLYESERNLRRLGIFTDVKIELEGGTRDEWDVYVITKDRWSTVPAVAFSVGGGVSNLGGKLEEKNLFGINGKLEVEGIYRTENEIGWQGRTSFYKERLFRSELAIDAEVLANRFKTDRRASLFKPFRTIASQYSYGVSVESNFGSDFLYGRFGDSIRLLNFHENKFYGWFTKAWLKKDKVYATLYMDYHDVFRGDALYRRAFDNTGKVLMAFSSTSEKYKTTRKANFFLEEDFQLGGYGTAILGKIFPIGNPPPGVEGESMYYVSATGEQSYFDKNWYLFARLGAGTGFQQNNAKYTFQEFLGLGYYRFNDDLLLATRVKQETAWNWGALRQLVMDNDQGLRGFEVNRLTGDNRLLANIELRGFLDKAFWIFQFSGVAFYDIGTVWNTNSQIWDSKFYSSGGLGIRLHNTKGIGDGNTIRVDFAYNFSDNKFGGIIITSRQLFSVFGNHPFRLPAVLGTQYDN